MYYCAVKNMTHKQSQKPPATVFLAATVVIFFLSLSAADSVGFVPDYIDGSVSFDVTQDKPLTTGGTQTIALASLPELGDASSTSGVVPTHLSIPAAGIDLTVQNPSTTDLNALDALLQNGPARYVSSAKLGEVGTVIIFAHSSHLPIVHNKMFQAFNNIPSLVAGDSITLSGADGTNYLYHVTRVYQADATDTSINVSPALGTRLVLVTCDTLTGKSARFVLEADFVGTI
jgi:sortase (surface protein transpeptidase)